MNQFNSVGEQNSSLHLHDKLKAMEEKIDRLEKVLTQVLHVLQLPVPSQFPLEDPDLLQNLEETPRNMQETRSIVAKSQCLEPLSYEPLDSEKSQIRLLVLWSSAESSSDIQADLMHVSLDEDTGEISQDMSIDDKRRIYALRNYIALSYTWYTSEDSQEEKTIFVNGHKFTVTHNLECALRELRVIQQTHSKKYLWIDQICKLTISNSTKYAHSQKVSIRKISKNAGNRSH
jgi:hypothetical protein